MLLRILKNKHLNSLIRIQVKRKIRKRKKRRKRMKKNKHKRDNEHCLFKIWNKRLKIALGWMSIEINMKNKIRDNKRMKKRNSLMVLRNLNQNLLILRNNNIKDRKEHYSLGILVMKLKRKTCRLYFKKYCLMQFWQILGQ